MRKLDFERYGDFMDRYFKKYKNVMKVAEQKGGKATQAKGGEKDQM